MKSFFFPGLHLAPVLREGQLFFSDLLRSGCMTVTLSPVVESGVVILDDRKANRYV